MRTYEVLFILSPQIPEDEATSLIGDFRGVAEKSGAKLINEEAWGKRRLAYPIEKANEGLYHLFVFESDGKSLSELDRKMKNSDKIIRHLISRTDLDHKRAAKLAARNPKKERVRPATTPMSAPSFASAPSQAAAPAAAPASAETPATPEPSTETPATSAE